MKRINRREFVSKAAMSISGALALTNLPAQLFAEAKAEKIPIGFQTFPIRDVLSKDFAGTLKMMASEGYEICEMCSPKGYATIGFGVFVNMKVADIKKTINDTGLTCPSCHFGFPEFQDNKLNESIDFAQQLGLSQMICSSPQ